MEQWIEKDLRYVWHPYTQMKDHETLPPILIEKAEGIKLYDDKGNYYYDVVSSWWCNLHGHKHPKIHQAMRDQLDTVDHVLLAGVTHRPAITLAERLVAISPNGLNKVFYSDDGSTAVETALKISFQYWQNIGRKEKKRFVALDEGYHGDTVGSMSVSAVDLFNEVFNPLFFNSIKVPSPYCYRCPMGNGLSKCNIECIIPLENILRDHGDEICAMIIEPMVMGASGMIVYPKEYLAKARKLTKKYDVHLIADEVAVGFGRTGKMFACEHANVEPDLMCLSKGLTAGYMPMGATLLTDEIYDAFYADYEQRKTFYHGHTYTGNPLACAAGIASLEVFEEEDTINKIQSLIPSLEQGLEQMRSLPHVGDVRCIGMIGAIELVKDKALKTPFSLAERAGYKVYQQGLANNILLRPLGSVVYLYLPLCTTHNELQDILERFYRTIEEVRL